jgi:hypothetical protein
MIVLSAKEIQEKCNGIINRKSNLTPFPDLMRKTTSCEVITYGKTFHKFDFSVEDRKLLISNKINLSIEDIEKTKEFYKNLGIELTDEETVELLTLHEFSHAFLNTLKLIDIKLDCDKEEDFGKCVIERFKKFKEEFKEQEETEVERLARIFGMK